MCSNINDTDTRLRLLGESVCNFNCNRRRFGKNCEICSNYMSRVGNSPNLDYSWNDNSDYKCYQVNENTGYEYCSEITKCSRCVRSSSCIYNDFECTPGVSLTVVQTPKDYFDACSSQGVTDHDYSV